MSFTERIMSSKPFEELQADHTIRYIFAKNFVNDARVLDAGCGSGYGSSYLARNRAKNVVGIDISKEAIELARKLYGAHGNLEFLVMDCTEMAFANREFDIITSFEVIEHILNHRKFLSEVCRVLKSNGLFLVSTPRATREKSLNPWHIKEFYPTEFHKLLKDYFDDVHMLGQHIIGQLKFHEQINLLIDKSRIPILLPNKLKEIVQPIYYSIITSEPAKLNDLVISPQKIDAADVVIGVCRKPLNM